MFQRTHWGKFKLTIPTNKIFVVDKDGNLIQIDKVTFAEVKTLDVKKATADTGVVDEDHTV
jgi:hypothetical protein